MIKKIGKLLLWLAAGYLLFITVVMGSVYLFSEEKKPQKSMMDIEKEHMLFHFLEQPDLLQLKQTAKHWKEGSVILMFACNKVGKFPQLKQEDFSQFEVGSYTASTSCSKKLYVLKLNGDARYLPLLGSREEEYIPATSLEGIVPEKVFDNAYKLNYYITQRLKAQSKRTSAMQTDPNSLIFEKEAILKTLPKNGQTYHYPAFVTFFDKLFSFLVLISVPLLTYYIALFLKTSAAAGMSIAAEKKEAEDSDAMLILITVTIFVVYLLLVFSLFDVDKIIVDAFLFPFYLLFGVLLYLPFVIVKTVFSVAFGHSHLTELMMNEALIKEDLFLWFSQRFFTVDIDMLSVDFIMFVLQVSVIFLFLPKIHNVLAFLLTGLFREGSSWSKRAALLLTLTVLTAFAAVNLENFQTLSMLTQMIIEEA